MLVVAAVSVGCGGSQSDTLKKRVQTLQDEVDMLQTNVDRLEERVAARDAAAAERPTPPAPVAAASSERPRLQVVKVQPDSPDAEEEPTPAVEPAPDSAEAPKVAPDAPRPVIRGTGDRIETHLPPGSSSRSDGGARPGAMGHNGDGRGG